MSVVVGLGGGIGSGKSALADLLVAKGALLIDADQVAREVVQVGTPTYEALRKRFGSSILLDDGSLDRGALAAITFGDPEALKDLNNITHPAIGALMAQRRKDFATGDAIVVVAIPLLRREHKEALELDAVVIVDVDRDVALERLITYRHMDENDARARIASQMSRTERLLIADYVVTNSGTLESLGKKADALWEWLVARRDNRTDTL
jgi:dephospho-CoA kinase